MVRARLTVLSLAGVALVGFLGATASANVLVNPGFESPNASAGDAGMVASFGWTPFNFAFATQAVTPHSGSQSLKIYGPWNQYGGSGVSQTAPASAGQTWTAGAWLMDASSDAIQGANFGLVQLNFLDASNNALLPQALGTPNFDASYPVDVWTWMSVSGTAPAGTASVQITLLQVQMNNPVTGGSTFFDDASLAPTTVPEPASLALLAIPALALLRRRR